MSEVERLCRYTKNDSLIRWWLECDQREIDAARKRIAKARPVGSAYLSRQYQAHDAEAELRTRTRRAQASNQRYMHAVRKAHG